MNIKSFKSLYAMLALVSISAAAYADSCTVTASDPNLASVQAAVNSAPNGAVVCVPPGTATWTGALAIPSTKSIVLQGAGVGVTSITHNRSGSQAHLIEARAHATLHTRITGFSFLNGTYDRRFIRIDGSPTDATYRIDHNEFFSTDNAVQIDLFGGGRGLVDHNYMQSNDNFELIHIFGPADGWTIPVVPGSDDAVYVEDNTFVNKLTSGNFLGGSAFQSYDGARTVARHNYCSYCQFDQHGTAGMVGARWWEFYENTFFIPFSGANQDKYFDIRAGSGVIFNNYKTGSANAGGGGLVFREEDSGSYPLLYQVGRGQNQTLDPAYVWNNSAAMNIYVASGPIQFNRDVYQSAKPGYTPYTYPHPLVSASGGGSSSDALVAPTSLTVTVNK